MLTINQYVKASSLEEAYELNQKRSNVVLGGMLWLKMQKRNVGTAIDLSGLGLDTIEETESEFRIGAMVTLRQMELHKGLNDLTQGAARESVRHIVGVQFRNMATVGGSVFGRYGFSDVLTFLMAAGAEVELYKRGRLSVEEFAYLPYDNDILTYVIVPKRPVRAAYLSQRNTKTDFPVLACCVTEIEGEIRCVVGARPMKTVCLRDEKGLLAEGITEESAEKFGAYVSETVETSSNLRGSAHYRKIIAGVLAKRALLQIAGEEEKKEKEQEGRN